MLIKNLIVYFLIHLLCTYPALTLSQTTNLVSSEVKELARDNSEFDENERKFSKRVENIVGKGEIATSNFCFSHSVFKRLVLQTHKNKALFGKVLKELIW